MKNTIIIIVCSLVTCSMGQSSYANRTFIGVAVYGSQPVLNFCAKGYRPGLGGAVSVLSPKITLSDSNALWLRFGASINSSSQGSQVHNTPLGKATIKNSHLGLNVLARLSKEKKERWRPFAELAGNWNVFSSQFSPDYQLPKATPNFYDAQLFGMSLSAGYMLRITDGFLFEAKLSYLQAFKAIDFAKVGAMHPTSYSTPFIVRAAPSMCMLYLGILFRLPPSRAYNRDTEYDRPHTEPQSQPQQRDVPRNWSPKKEGRRLYTPF